MNRSVEIRLKRLEAASSQKKATRRSHMFAARTPAEGDAKIAELVANGAAHPDDWFIQLVPSQKRPSTGRIAKRLWTGRSELAALIGAGV